LNNPYLLVRLSVSSVRPWYPPSKQMTEGRPVYFRASMTAYSTLSAPLLVRMVFFRNVPGVISFSTSARRTYGS